MSKTKNLNKSKKYDDFFISSILIDGLFSRYNLHWELNDDVNILVGKNGSGKTTISNLIKTSTSNPATEKLNESSTAEVILLHNKFKHFKMKLKNTSEIDTISLKDDNSHINIIDDMINEISNQIIDKYKDHNPINNEKIKEIKESIIKEASMINLHKTMNKNGLLTKTKITPPIEMDKVLDYHTNFKVISTFDTLILSKKEYDSRSDSVFSQLDFVLKAESEKLKSLIISNGNKVSSDYSSLDSNTRKNKENAFKEIKESIFAQISEFKNQANTFLKENEKSLEIGKNGDLNILQDNKIIPHEHLSSGEKQLLFVLLTVLNLTDKPTVLVLDEPELSLHLSWQEKLIKAIKSIHPQLQLIITTHSPAIVMKGWMDKMVDINSLLTEIKEEKKQEGAV